MAKTWTEELPVPLTHIELLDRGEALALQEKLWREADNERKDVADAYKGKLTKIEGEQARLAAIVRDRQEPRPVVVKQHMDFAAGAVLAIRTDTGEVVRTRAMTDAERQMELAEAAQA